MKRNRISAPLARPSMTAPMSDPRLRFMTAGPEGGEGAAEGSAGAPAGDDGYAGDLNEGKGDEGDEKTLEDPPAEGDDEHGSTADDPKLKAARDEAAQNRIRAREAKEAADTAASKYDQLVQTLGKGLGLIKDDGDGEQAPDPEALAQQVAESQTAAQEAARELAVYKAARGANADPDKLLDSRSFLASIKDVDHTDQAAVKTAVEDAVKANQSFALGRVSGASTADTASGPGGGSAPKAEMSIQDAVSAHYRN